MGVTVIALAIDVLPFTGLVNDGPEHPRLGDFPSVGSTLDAVVDDCMPWGELRLSERTPQGPH
ncbi:hypothetical protein [Streptomyces sp. NPDC059349]|uniref:hypothetical protein n=1 Tax=Streptomyces sp. NPDC059349 TaxID=3346808 RepID=UPI0036776D97